MNEITKYIFFFLIGTTLINFLIAIAARWKTNHKEFNPLILYWTTLFGTYGAVAVLSGNPTQIGFSFFFQFVSFFIASKMLSDSRIILIDTKNYVIIHAVACVVSSFLLLYTELGFTASLIPVVLSTSLPAVKPVLNTLIFEKDKSNWIEKGMAYLLISAVINNFNYAFFRLDESAAWWGWSVSIAQYQCFSIFMPLLINYRREEKEKRNLQTTLEKLSGQNQSNNMEIDELYRNLELQIAQKEELYTKLGFTNAHLEEEREMNEILIRTVSHDLANPLTVINAYIDMIHSGKIPAHEQEKIWGRTKQSIQSALDMIGRIRNAILTRSQADLMAIHQVSVDRCLKKLFDLFETKLQDKNITLRYDNSVPLETLVAAEENGLSEHVFSNILSNAIKFSYPNSEIHITVTETYDCVQVEFRDFGKGIDEQRLQKRLLASTNGTSGEVGTGFGLMVMGYFLRKFGAIYELKSQTSGHLRGTSVIVSLKKSQSLGYLEESSLFRSPTLYS